MAAGWFPPDVRRDEDEHFSEPTVFDRVSEYDMRMPIEEMLGFRKRLADGYRLELDRRIFGVSYEDITGRRVDPLTITDPETGERIHL